MEKADLPHQPGTKPCDWPEDFAHENGNYMNTCVHCRSLFYGHKRRASCKVCSSANAGVSMDGEPMGDPHPCDSTNRPDLSAIRACLEGTLMHLIEEVVDKRVAARTTGATSSDPELMRAAFYEWVEEQGCDTDGAWSAWQGCWNLLTAGVLASFKVGDRVMFRGIEHEIFANGDRPGTFDICQPGWPAGTDRWLNVPPEQLAHVSGVAEGPVCPHGIHMDNACGACVPPRGTTVGAPFKTIDAAIAEDAQ